MAKEPKRSNEKNDQPQPPQIMENLLDNAFDETSDRLNKILSFNAGAFSSDTVFQEKARKAKVSEIEHITKDKPYTGD